MRQRFIQKTKHEEVPVKYNVLRESIRGIKRLIVRFKRDAYRSNVPEYVLKREEKIEKLQLIIVDLKRLL